MWVSAWELGTSGSILFWEQFKVILEHVAPQEKKKYFCSILFDWLGNSLRAWFKGDSEISYLRAGKNPDSIIPDCSVDEQVTGTAIVTF